MTERWRHLASSVTLLKKLCSDLFLESSKAVFLVFLLFSGEDLGEGLVEEARRVGFAVAVRKRFAFRVPELDGSRLLDEAVEELELPRFRNGKRLPLLLSSSSSDRMVDDVRSRFAGRGFDDMPVMEAHVVPCTD